MNRSTIIKFLPSFLIMLAWVYLSYALYYYQINSQFADTTFVAQILYNFKHTWEVKTSLGTSIIESMDHIWGQPSAQICSLPLNSSLNNLPWFHYYFVMYLLVPFARLMDISLLLAISQAGIYLSVLIFTYYFAKRSGLNFFLAVLFVILVSQHPLWIYGLYGQFYFNRFFLPFSALFIWLLTARQHNYFWLTLSGILAVSANEIYGLALAIILTCYFFINRNFNRRLALMAGLFLTYTVISLYTIQHNLGFISNQTGFISQATQGGFTGLVVRLQRDILSQNTQIFLFVNVVSMGIMALFYRRTLVPFLLILLPNLLVNIGGAEKTGWSTHYHISYCIPLIWLSLVGFSQWKVNSFHKSIILGILILISATINPYTLKLNPRPFIALRDLSRKSITSVQNSSINLDFRQRLQQAVGDGQSATLLEPSAYHLFQSDIYYYPHNLDQVDNVILRYNSGENGLSRFASISYTGQFDSSIDDCIFARMQKQGYDFSNPIIVDDWAVIKRKKL